MPFIDLTVDGQQVTGFVCGRGLKSCSVCGRVSTRQCDYLMRPKPSRARCNRHCCSQHSVPLTAAKDACMEHAPICLAAIARRAAMHG